MTADPTKRFSNRVENYLKYRPSYPTAILEYLRRAGELTATTVIADIGSGTGILSELFLQYGNPVFAVEPNDDMRRAAEARLSAYRNFTSVASTAEATTLLDTSVDLVTAGQAFHWFNAPQARIEFARILRPGGFVALIWNRQDSKAAPFMHGFAALLDTYALDYNIVKHSRESVEEDIALLFDGRMQVEVFSNEQRFDFAGLRGRLLSSSYAPLPGHANYKPMIVELRRLFEAHRHNGKITFKYETYLYLGQVH